jgi:hypothetical protein
VCAESRIAMRTIPPSDFVTLFRLSSKIPPL